MSLDLTTGRTPAVRILGPAEILGRGGAVSPGGKPATVLAALALHAGDWVPTARLVELVWPDREPPASAANNLKTYVWQLRRLLGGAPRGISEGGAAEGGVPANRGRIDSRPGGYRLRPEPDVLDADIVLAAVDQAGEWLRAGRAAEVAERVPGVLALWRGRPYDEIADHCSHPVFARLADQRMTLREYLAEAYLVLGRNADALDLLTAVTAEDPARELTWVKLIHALRRAGRVREALAAYQKARNGLIHELGIEPGPELAAAHQAVLACGRVPAEPAGAQARGPGAEPGHGWPPPHQLPRRSEVEGRTGELRTLIAAGRSDTTVPVLTVSGAAGTGKTEVAVAAGHALAERFPDGQLFVDLRTRADALSVTEALGRLIRSVAGPGTWLPGSADERAALWRSVSYGRRLLLLADDVRDGEQLRPLLPASPGCLVLATSRNRITGIDGRTDVLLATPPPRALQPAPTQTAPTQTAQDQPEVRVA